MKKLLGSYLAIAVLGCSARNAPPVASAPPPERFVEHTIAFQGETLGVIARWYTGSVANWPAIAAANRELDPKRLQIGQVVRVPEVLALKREPFSAEYLGRPETPSAPVVVAKLADESRVVDAPALSGDLAREEAPTAAEVIEVSGGEVVAPSAGGADQKLYEAVMLEDAAMAKELLAKGANPNFRQSNRPLLAHAAQTPESTVLAVLIEGGAELNARDGIGHTALMRAVAVNSLSNVQLLIKAKADVNLKDGDGATPLLSAVRDNYTEIVRALLDAGADPSIADNEGESAALLAAQGEGLELVKMLGEAKANFNISNAAYTPLTYAISQRRPELVSAVLAAGADPNVKSAADQYPLHMAMGEIEIVKILLAAKADPNRVDAYGTSPLGRAIQDGDLASAEALIGAGADVHAKNQNGSSLLSGARYSSNPEIAKLLEAHGAREE